MQTLAESYDPRDLFRDENGPYQAPLMPRLDATSIEIAIENYNAFYEASLEKVEDAGASYLIKNEAKASVTKLK